MSQSTFSHEDLECHEKAMAITQLQVLQAREIADRLGFQSNEEGYAQLVATITQTIATNFQAVKVSDSHS